LNSQENDDIITQTSNFQIIVIVHQVTTFSNVLDPN